MSKGEIQIGTIDNDNLIGGEAADVLNGGYGNCPSSGFSGQLIL